MELIEHKEYVQLQNRASWIMLNTEYSKDPYLNQNYIIIILVTFSYLCIYQ